MQVFGPMDHFSNSIRERLTVRDVCALIVAGPLVVTRNA